MTSGIKNLEIHIASLVVQFLPEYHDDVVQHIKSNLRASVHEGDLAGKLVVVLETENEAIITQAMSDMSRLPGVLSVNMVYHHSDTEDALNEVIVR